MRAPSRHNLQYLELSIQMPNLMVAALRKYPELTRYIVITHPSDEQIDFNEQAFIIFALLQHSGVINLYPENDEQERKWFEANLVPIFKFASETAPNLLGVVCDILNTILKNHVALQKSHCESIVQFIKDDRAAYNPYATVDDVHNHQLKRCVLLSNTAHMIDVLALKEIPGFDHLSDKVSLLLDYALQSKLRLVVDKMMLVHDIKRYDDKALDQFWGQALVLVQHQPQLIQLLGQIFERLYYLNELTLDRIDFVFHQIREFFTEESGDVNIGKDCLALIEMLSHMYIYSYDFVEGVSNETKAWGLSLNLVALCADLDITVTQFFKEFERLNEAEMIEVCRHLNTIARQDVQLIKRFALTRLIDDPVYASSDDKTTSPLLWLFNPTVLSALMRLAARYDYFLQDDDKYDLIDKFNTDLIRRLSIDTEQPLSVIQNFRNELDSIVCVSRELLKQNDLLTRTPSRISATGCVVGGLFRDTPIQPFFSMESVVAPENRSYTPPRAPRKERGAGRQLQNLASVACALFRGESDTPSTPSTVSNHSTPSCKGTPGSVVSTPGGDAGNNGSDAGDDYKPRRLF